MRYPSDPGDGEWAPSGPSWRMEPKDFPPWQLVYDPISRWTPCGVWAAALDEIKARHRKKRSAAGPR